MTDPRCTCPHGERSLGVLNRINMGRGVVRLSTTRGCPVHDACHGWTRAARIARRVEAPWSDPYCPVHATRDCPEGQHRDGCASWFQDQLTDALDGDTREDAP